MRSLVLEDARRPHRQEVPEPERRHERDALLEPATKLVCTGE